MREINKRFLKLREEEEEHTEEIEDDVIKQVV